MMDKCCQCEIVASTNINFQFAGAKAAADKLEIGNIGIGNIGIGNISTLATFYKTF